MPVRKMVTRSLRGAGGDFTPKIRFSSFGTSGSRTRSSAAASLRRFEAVEDVLAREIDHRFVDERHAEARHLHEIARVGRSLPGAIASPIAGRLAVDQTPMTAFGSLGPDGARRCASARDIGTWIASVLTFKPGRAVLDLAGQPTPSRSKIAEVDEEALVALTGEDAHAGRRRPAARRRRARRSSGVERGPMFGGGTGSRPRAARASSRCGAGRRCASGDRTGAR